MQRQLIVYAKSPLPGHAKTRLGAAIGPAAAAGVYARLLYAYLLDLLRSDLIETDIVLSVAAPEDVPFFEQAFPELTIRPQVAGDLGQRMAASFERAFAAGAERVVLTGSDVPGLEHWTVVAAFAELVEVPVVVGPAADGGYYLLGMRAPGADLFTGVAWSTERVLDQTLERAAAQGLEVATLPQRVDLDNEADFVWWQDRLLGRET
jgi:hypothetical protein